MSVIATDTAEYLFLWDSRVPISTHGSESDSDSVTYCVTYWLCT